MRQPSLRGRHGRVGRRSAPRQRPAMTRRDTPVDGQRPPLLRCDAANERRMAAGHASSGGDGGNRTRVRKIQPRNSTSVACRGQSPQGSRRASNPAAICWSFAHLAESCAALHLCHARSVTGWRSGAADAASQGGRAVISSLMQRGAWQHRKCCWHLRFCADFTRSAPLGSHSGASLSRRSLSSPESGS
jgi:hypothetical protein